MKRIRMFALALGCTLLLSGCLSGITTSNSLSQDGLRENLVVGKTTKADVKKVYGEPTSIAKKRSGDTWVYVFEPSKMNSAMSGVAQGATSAAVAEGTSRATLGGIKAGGMVGGMAASSAATHAGAAASASVDKAIPRETKRLRIQFDKFDTVKSYTLN